VSGFASGWRDEHVHAEIARKGIMDAAQQHLRRVVRLGEEGRDPVDQAEPGILARVRDDARQVVTHGVDVEIAHAPERGVGVGEPGLQHEGVALRVGGDDRGRECHRAAPTVAGASAGTPKSWKAMRRSIG